MIFRSTEQIDDVWEQIKTAVEDGMLGFEAKVSTCYEKRGKLHICFFLLPRSRIAKIFYAMFTANAAHVICIYTYDHTNEIDVLRVREELRTMGFTEELGYKTNAATNAGIYQSTGHKKVCKYRC